MFSPESGPTIQFSGQFHWQIIKPGDENILKIENPSSDKKSSDYLASKTQNLQNAASEGKIVGARPAAVHQADSFSASSWATASPPSAAGHPHISHAVPDMPRAEREEKETSCNADLFWSESRPAAARGSTAGKEGRARSSVTNKYLLKKSVQIVIKTSFGNKFKYKINYREIWLY